MRASLKNYFRFQQPFFTHRLFGQSLAFCVTTMVDSVSTTLPRRRSASRPWLVKCDSIRWRISWNGSCSASPLGEARPDRDWGAIGGPTNDTDVLSLRTAMKNTIFSRMNHVSIVFWGLRTIIPDVKHLCPKRGLFQPAGICHGFFPLFSDMLLETVADNPQFSWFHPFDESSEKLPWTISRIILMDLWKTTFYYVFLGFYFYIYLGCYERGLCVFGLIMAY